MDDRDITYKRITAEVGASLACAAQELPKFPENLFFRSRRTFERQFEHGALGEVKL